MSPSNPPASSRVLLEICCGSVDDAIAAEQGGGNRVELCSSLFLGGLTPSLGSIIEAKRRLSIPVCVMLRPRGGGFCYTEAEWAAMEHDARAAIEHDASGLVFGALTETGQLDLARCERFIKLVAGRAEVVFHRALDVVPDPLAALEQLINLGVTRVLTTGQRNYIFEGLPLVREMVARAGQRMQVMPGGGHPSTIREVVERTGCTQIHMATFKPMRDSSTAHRPDIFYGGALYPPENVYDLTDRDSVAAMRAALDRA